MSVTDFFLIAFSWCVPWWLPPYTFPHLHFRVPSWLSLVPILTELYSISYILPDHVEAFQTLDSASFFCCIISNLDFRLVVLPWFGPRIHLRALSPRISVTMKCVSLQSTWIWMLYICYSVGLMAVSSKAVEKACRPTGGLPSLSPLHHSTITKGGA